MVNPLERSDSIVRSDSFETIQPIEQKQRKSKDLSELVQEKLPTDASRGLSLEGKRLSEKGEDIEFADEYMQDIAKSHKVIKHELEKPHHKGVESYANKANSINDQLKALVSQVTNILRDEPNKIGQFYADNENKIEVLTSALDTLETKVDEMHIDKFDKTIDHSHKMLTSLTANNPKIPKVDLNDDQIQQSIVPHITKLKDDSARLMNKSLLLGTKKSPPIDELKRDMNSINKGLKQVCKHIIHDGHKMNISDCTHLNENQEELKKLNKQASKKVIADIGTTANNLVSTHGNIKQSEDVFYVSREKKIESLEGKYIKKLTELKEQKLSDDEIVEKLKRKKEKIIDLINENLIASTKFKMDYRLISHGITSSRTPQAVISSQLHHTDAKYIAERIKEDIRNAA